MNKSDKQNKLIQQQFEKKYQYNEGDTPMDRKKQNEQQNKLNFFDKNKNVQRSSIFKPQNKDTNQKYTSMFQQKQLNNGERLTFRIQILRDVLRCISLFFIVSMSSLCLIFENTPWQIMWYSAYTYSLLSLLYIDLFLIFFYGVQFNGSYVCSIKNVFYYLIKYKWFKLLTPLFSFTLFVITGLQIKLLLFGIFSGVFEIQYIINSIGERIFNSIKWLYIVKLLKLFLLIFFFAHSIACLWIYVPQKIQHDNWIMKYNLQNQTWGVQYINALYYIVISMVTVGYGDITPANPHEKVMCSMIIIISCGMYGYSLNQIGVIFHELNKNSILVQEKKIYINQFMLRKNVSESLQCRVREYLDYFWQQQFDDNSLEEGFKIIQQLNSNLKKQLIFENSPIFAKNFSLDFLKKLTEIISEQKFMPEEIIYEQNSSDNNSIYFIEQGDVQIIQKSKDSVQVIQELGKGQNFGYFSFFTGQPRELTTRSKNFSVLLKIDLKPFLEILKEFEDDYEKYYFIRDSIMFNSRFDLIGQKCSRCCEDSHQIKECPNMHYICDRLNLVKSQHSESNYTYERNPYNRYRMKKNSQRSKMVNQLERFVDFAIAYDEFLNKYEEDYLKQFYSVLDLNSPRMDLDLQSNKYNFSQALSKLYDDRENMIENEQNKEEKTNLDSIKVQYANNNIKTLTHSINEFTGEETSIFSKQQGKRNSALITMSSVAQHTPKNNPHSNGNISRHNTYFYQNQSDEEASKVDRCKKQYFNQSHYFKQLQQFKFTQRLRFFYLNVHNFKFKKQFHLKQKVLKMYSSTYKSMDDKLHNDAYSRLSKMNIKREKSIRSFRKLLTQSSSSKRQMTSPLQQSQKQMFTNSNDETDLYKSYTSYIDFSQKSKRNMKLEYDAMKLMKIYFVKDNYDNVLDRFNQNNRNYGVQIRREKERFNILLSSQGSAQLAQYLDQNKSLSQENTQNINNDEQNISNNQNEIQNSLLKLSGNPTPLSLLRSSTISVIKMNTNKSKTKNILKAFLSIQKSSNMLDSNSQSFISSSEQSELSKLEDDSMQCSSIYPKSSVLKSKPSVKMSQFQKEYLDSGQKSNRLINQQDSLRDTSSYKGLNTNMDNTILDITNRDDLQSDIQLESKINMHSFHNLPYQTKRNYESSTFLSQSTFTQNESNQNKLHDQSNQNDKYYKHDNPIDKSSFQLCKEDNEDDDFSRKRFVNFESFSEK